MILWISPAGLPRSYDKRFTLVALETLLNNLYKKEVAAGIRNFSAGLDKV
jgi:hypothetical protein